MRYNNKIVRKEEASLEQKKVKRGRPRLDTRITENGAPSRRQAVNAMYMYEGVHLISVAATEIPDSSLLWQSDDVTRKAKGKNGILEQLGRMIVQDLFPQEDGVYIANLAIAALKNGEKSRDIEKAIREIRITSKERQADPTNEELHKAAQESVMVLYDMGGLFNQPL